MPYKMYLPTCCKYTRELEDICNPKCYSDVKLYRADALLPRHFIEQGKESLLHYNIKGLRLISTFVSPKSELRSVCHFIQACRMSDIIPCEGFRDTIRTEGENKNYKLFSDEPEEHV